MTLGWNNVVSTLYQSCATLFRCCVTLFRRCFNVGHWRCINVVQRWKSDVGFCFVFNVDPVLKCWLEGNKIFSLTDIPTFCLLTVFSEFLLLVLLKAIKMKNNEKCLKYLKFSVHENHKLNIFQDLKIERVKNKKLCSRSSSARSILRNVFCKKVFQQTFSKISPKIVELKKTWDKSDAPLTNKSKSNQVQHFKCPPKFWIRQRNVFAYFC